MATSDNNLDALTSFLTFGLTNYAEDLSPDDRECAVRKALYDLAQTSFKTSDENALLVKWWEHVAFATPTKTKDSPNSIVWKERKDLK